MRKEGEEEEVDDVEKAVLLYNIALVHYQTKNFEKALIILEKLFKLIEPLEEGLGGKCTELVLYLQYNLFTFYLYSEFSCSVCPTYLHLTLSSFSLQDLLSPGGVLLVHLPDRGSRHGGLLSR